MSNATAIPMPDLSLSWGAAYIGVLFATFFQGLLTMQVYAYYESFPEDTWKMKTFVASLWSLDLLHLIFIGQALWHYLVVSWGHPETLGFIIWTFDAHIIPLAIVTIMCQAFFIWRLWVFSKKYIPVIVFLASLCLAAFGLYIFTAVDALQNGTPAVFHQATPEISAVFSIGAASDLFIALLLCWYLREKRSDFDFGRSSSIVTRLMRYTVSTGLATSILAIACLVVYFASKTTFLFIALHFSLGRMYTNCLLANLNARRTLRVGRDFTGGRGGMGSVPSGNEHSGIAVRVETVYDVRSGGISRSPGSEDFELKPVVFDV